MRILAAFTLIPAALVIAVLALIGPVHVGQSSPLPPYLHEIHITARQSGFDPSQITVKMGSRVKIVLTDEDVEHGLTIPALGLTALKTSPRTAVLEFTPQQPGRYEFRCDVQCGLGHDRMRGLLIVE